jgi:hypothetical protein
MNLEEYRQMKDPPALSWMSNSDAEALFDEAIDALDELEAEWMDGLGIFLICYEGKPLVLVRKTTPCVPRQVLDWYGENYAFDRSKLTWTSVHNIVYDREAAEAAKNGKA